MTRYENIKFSLGIIGLLAITNIGSMYVLLKNNNFKYLKFNVRPK
tara:strand:- start:607 stop:741 length:135 start_codon:yes stop_codon:yes gene_type:complete